MNAALRGAGTVAREERDESGALGAGVKRPEAQVLTCQLACSDVLAVMSFVWLLALINSLLRYQRDCIQDLGWVL